MTLPPSPFTSANEQMTAHHLCKLYPELGALKTGAQTARMDLVFVKGDTVYAVAEVKKRKFGMGKQEQYGSTMIEWSKYESGVSASVALGVPFVVIVELTDATMLWKVTDSTGETIIPVERTNRSAQVSEVNKGKVLKDCALLDNAHGKVISEKSTE